MSTRSRRRGSPRGRNPAGLRRRAGRWGACAAIWVILALAVGARAEPEPSSGDEPIALRWAPDGKRILVARRWLFDLEERRFTPVPAPPRGEGGGTGKSELAFSPDGKRTLLLEDEALYIGPTGGPLGPAVPILPRGQSPDREVLGPLAFWVSPRTVYVQMTFKRTGSGDYESQCRLYDSQAGKWRLLPRGCVSGDMSGLGRVVPGPGNWIAVESSAEGISVVGFRRFDPRKGLQATRMRPLSSYGCPVEVRFAPGGARADLITPCRPCREVEGCTGDVDLALPSPLPERWNLYSLPLGAVRPLRLRRSDLPLGATLDPTRERFAWVRGGELCLGDPRDRSARCTPLPR